jgi:hypothetical protein
MRYGTQEDLNATGLQNLEKANSIQKSDLIFVTEYRYPSFRITSLLFLKEGTFKLSNKCTVYGTFFLAAVHPLLRRNAGAQHKEQTFLFPKAKLQDFTATSCRK